MPLFCGEIAARLLFEQREDLDHLLRGRQVRLCSLASDGIGNIAKVHGSRVRERQHEADEGDGRSFMIVRGMVQGVVGHGKSEW